ncbi:MAG TPA: alpha/beta hydrolase [Planctomycetota bacterium]|nr:alpha/beta hydrolase [Planctomycetota bacterium]
MQTFLDDDDPDGPAPDTVVRSVLRLLGSLGLLAGLAAPLGAQLGPPTMVNVAYGPYTDPTTPHSDERLDLYAHSDAVGLQPVLIEIHPGGFTSGSKSDFTSYLDDDDGIDAIDKAYAAGFAVVSIDYPLAATLFADGQPNPKFPKNKSPRAAHSVRRAIQFVRSKAGAWKLDPDRIFLIGNSAGANLGLWVAMTKDIAKPQSSNPVAQQSSRPNGVVFLSAPTFLDAAHIVMPPDKPAMMSFFGKKTQAALEKPSAIKKSLAASPAWRAGHAKSGTKFSDAMVELNASMPLLGIYKDLDPSATSSSYTFPVDDPHSAAMGLLLREALDAYAEESQNPSAHWTDFMLLNQEPTDPEGGNVTADAVVDWLKAHATTLRRN